LASGNSRQVLPNGDGQADGVINLALPEAGSGLLGLGSFGTCNHAPNSGGIFDLNALGGKAGTAI
jgi:hypothetical protein